MARADQRGSREDEPAAAPKTSAKARVAISAPAIRINELTTPSRNIVNAGAIVSMGRVTSRPSRLSTHASNASTLSAKGVGLSSALSAGSTQAGLELPVSVLHSGR